MYIFGTFFFQTILYFDFNKNTRLSKRILTIFENPCFQLKC
jgi:hypothetical protein